MRRIRKLRQALGDLYIRPVTTPDGVSLGWAVCVLKQDNPTSQEGDMLILGHFTHFYEAESAESGFRIYTAEEKKFIAALAFPSEIWEWLALPQVGSDEVGWTILEGDDLHAFRSNHYIVICEREDWHPAVSSSEAFQTHPKLAHLHKIAHQLLDGGSMWPRRPPGK